MEASASVMKSPNCAGGKRLRAIPTRMALMAEVLMLLTCLGFQSELPETIAPADQNSSADAGYVGSRVCSKLPPQHLRDFLAYRHGSFDVGNYSGFSGEDADIG